MHRDVINRTGQVQTVQGIYGFHIDSNGITTAGLIDNEIRTFSLDPIHWPSHRRRSR